MAMNIWKKHQTMLFINTAITGSESWARIGKSTIFNLALNPEVETFDFIEDENPTDLVKKYKPAIDQELRTVQGDPAFDAIFGWFYELPVGEAIVKDALLIFPKTATGGGFEAWKVKATLVLNGLNTVDEKVSFAINFNGTIAKGTATAENGVPVFTEDE